MKTREELQKNYSTIKTLSRKYFKGIRSIERTLAEDYKDYYHTENIYNDGQKLWIHNDIKDEVLCRRYTKYIHKTQDINQAIKQLRKDENELTVFGTLACKGVEDTKVLKHFMSEILSYYKSVSPNTTVRLLYGIEDNTNYFDNNNGWHIHWVSDCSGLELEQHKIEVNEIIQETLPPQDYNIERSCKVDKYIVGIGNGGLNYTIKNYTNINDRVNPLYGVLAK